jgi:hypothetical protein
MATVATPSGYGPADGALSERLRDPATIAALTRLLDRADDLARTVDTLTRVADRIPPTLAIVTDAADDAVRSAAASAIDVDERLRLALRLADRLTAPRTMAAVSALLDRLDLVERAVQLADRAPGYVAMAVDSADEILRDANDAGIDVAAGLTRGASAAIRFGALMGPDEVRSLEAVFRSGMLAPGAVRVIGGAGAAIAAAAAEEPSQVGLVEAFRALRHADVRRALGFLLRVAVHFGRTIGPPSRHTPPASGPARAAAAPNV